MKRKISVLSSITILALSSSLSSINCYADRKPFERLFKGPQEYHAYIKTCDDITWESSNSTKWIKEVTKVHEEKYGETIQRVKDGPFEYTFDKHCRLTQKLDGDDSNKIDYLDKGKDGRFIAKDFLSGKIHEVKTFVYKDNAETMFTETYDWQSGKVKSKIAKKWIYDENGAVNQEIEYDENGDPQALAKYTRDGKGIVEKHKIGSQTYRTDYQLKGGNVVLETLFQPYKTDDFRLKKLKQVELKYYDDGKLKQRAQRSYDKSGERLQFEFIRWIGAHGFLEEEQSFTYDFQGTQGISRKYTYKINDKGDWTERKLELYFLRGKEWVKQDSLEVTTREILYY